MHNGRAGHNDPRKNARGVEGVGGGVAQPAASPGADAVPADGDVARLGVGAGSLSEGVAPPGAGGSALAVESGTIETKAATPSAMAET